MRKLMTREDVGGIQFFKMPKVFFGEPRYMAMQNEAKLAYMLMMDLLPLSVENNWVNENDEVFVKLSRTKLMRLLNIKSTNKAAKVMKELVELGLIIYKKVGLNKCNEIYLYSLEGARTTKTKAAKTPKKDHAAPEDRHLHSQVLDSNIDQVQASLEDQVSVEDLKQRYDHRLVDEIINNMCEMYFNTSTRIGKQDKPKALIRSVISKLKMVHIEHVIDQFIKTATTTKIFSPKAYIQTLIYNAIYEANIKIVSHIKYNFGW